MIVTVISKFIYISFRVVVRNEKNESNITIYGFILGILCKLTQLMVFNSLFRHEEKHEYGKLGASGPFHYL